MQAKVSV